MKKLNLFISYSHLDEQNIDEFRKHIYPLKENGIIGTWYDRMIVAGQEFQDTIDNNLENADVICLFISANFLSSPACLKEKAKALELKKSRRVAVIPIILSACGWLDDKSINPSLALPTDGKAVNTFNNSSDAWHNIYKGLKAVVNLEEKIKSTSIKESFLSFLENAEMLTKAHSKKDQVTLNDIFVFPDLKKYDDIREYEKSESSEILINDILNNNKDTHRLETSNNTFNKHVFLYQYRIVPIKCISKVNGCGS